MGSTPGAAVAPQGASGTDSGMEFVRNYTRARSRSLSEPLPLFVSSRLFLVAWGLYPTGLLLRL